ncbi:hypothetical protein CXB37_22600 [Pseudomonas syringae pv. syringae]|nr:hypothetical protein CXB37_22600 [Pseudomonas syringae pv. syringae]
MAKYREAHRATLLPAGRRSELVRDLPGTGSKTCACGTSSANQVSKSGYSNLPQSCSHRTTQIPNNHLKKQNLMAQYHHGKTLQQTLVCTR